MSIDLESRVVGLQEAAEGPGGDAFGAIIRMYGGMVYGTGLRITGDAHHAADVTQETFFQLLQNAGRISGSLGGWLHRVATRRAIDLVRRDRSRRLREHAYAEQCPSEADSWADISPLVDEALNEMDEAARNFIIRHYLQGEKTIQIAAADGISQPTVSRRLGQALESLRDILRHKGVVVTITVLGSSMATSTASAVPAPVMAELGKMSLLSAGVTGSKSFLGWLNLKVGVAVLLAGMGTGGYILYKSSDASPATPISTAPAAIIPAQIPPGNPRTAGMAVQSPGKKGKTTVAVVRSNVPLSRVAQNPRKGP